MTTSKNQIEIEIDNDNAQVDTYIRDWISSLTIFNKAAIARNDAFLNRDTADLSTYVDYNKALDAYAEALIAIKKYI